MIHEFLLGTFVTARLVVEFRAPNSDVLSCANLKLNFARLFNGIFWWIHAKNKFRVPKAQLRRFWLAWVNFEMAWSKSDLWQCLLIWIQLSVLTMSLIRKSQSPDDWQCSICAKIYRWKIGSYICTICWFVARFRLWLLSSWVADMFNYSLTPEQKLKLVSFS